MIVVNFKTYKEASGEKALSLIRDVCEVAKKTGVEIVVCLQGVDLRKAISLSDCPFWAQHVDPAPRGRSTGWLPAEVAKEAGAQGTLLNHSEHKLSVGVLGETMVRCKSVGLKTIVLADSLEEAKIVAKYEPDWIGYEPPELIASKETSVARAKPQIIEEVVRVVPNVPILVGAGVKDTEDVRVSLKLGARGVVVSSAVVLAQNPKEVLFNLAAGFKQEVSKV